MCVEQVRSCASTLRILVLVRPYEKLHAWKAAHELALSVYHVTEKFPRDERFGLVSQSRRAAISVPANIAEGCAKRGSKEYRRFLDISLGSLSELSYLLRISRDLGFLTEERCVELDSKLSISSKLAWGLYNWTQRDSQS